MGSGRERKEPLVTKWWGDRMNRYVVPRPQWSLSGPRSGILSVVGVAVVVSCYFLLFGLRRNNTECSLKHVSFPTGGSALRVAIVRRRKEARAKEMKSALPSIQFVINEITLNSWRIAKVEKTWEACVEKKRAATSDWGLLVLPVSFAGYTGHGYGLWGILGSPYTFYQHCFDFS